MSQAMRMSRTSSGCTLRSCRRNIFNALPMCRSTTLTEMPSSSAISRFFMPSNRLIVNIWRDRSGRALKMFRLSFQLLEEQFLVEVVQKIGAVEPFGMVFEVEALQPFAVLQGLVAQVVEALVAHHAKQQRADGLQNQFSTLLPQLHEAVLYDVADCVAIGQKAQSIVVQTRIVSSEKIFVCLMLSVSDVSDKQVVVGINVHHKTKPQSRATLAKIQ